MRRLLLSLLLAAGCGEPVATLGVVQGQLVFNLEEGLDPVSLAGHRIEIDGPDEQAAQKALEILLENNFYED